MRQEIRRFAGYLREEKKLSENTVSAYERDLEQFLRYLGKRRIRQLSRVTGAVLHSYLLLLEREGLTPSTICRAAVSLRAFFRFEVAEGKLPESPAKALRIPKLRKKESEVLSEEEFSRILLHAGGDSPRLLRDRAMFRLLYATGIRVSELVGLSLSDVNMQIGFLTCRGEERERNIPFDREILPDLERYLEEGRPALLGDSESEAFFVSCRGEDLSRQGVFKIIKTCARNAGIEKTISPHVFRHTVAVRLMNRGADPKSTRMIMGYTPGM